MLKTSVEPCSDVVERYKFASLDFDSISKRAQVSTLPWDSKCLHPYHISCFVNFEF
jgi:hypothetical protein